MGARRPPKGPRGPMPGTGFGGMFGPLKQVIEQRAEETGNKGGIGGGPKGPRKDGYTPGEGRGGKDKFAEFLNKMRGGPAPIKEKPEGGRKPAGLSSDERRKRRQARMERRKKARVERMRTRRREDRGGRRRRR